MFWFFGYTISQINSTFNYFIYKFFGLSEEIDTIQSIQPDGTNWRGITSSHELTGFWLLLVLCICIYQIVANKSKVYFAVLPLTLVAIGWNSSKTVIILLVIFILHQVLTNLKITLCIFL